MPNYVEIGEEGLALARQALRGLREDPSGVLTREGTSLLERSGYLTRDGLAHDLSYLLSDRANRELPAIQRSLGLGDRARSDVLVVGTPGAPPIIGPGGWRPQAPIQIYEPHRNVSIYPDASVTVATPTPSGQRLLVQRFNVQGEFADINMHPRYIESVTDQYPNIPKPGSPGIAMLSQVVTHPDSRQFSAGGNWIFDKENFTPSPSLVERVRATKPVDVSSAQVDKHLGAWVDNHLANGWLIGFDKVAGEAIVTTHDWASPGFGGWITKNTVVRNLDGLYPIEMRAYDGSKYTAYRNALGQIFEAERTSSGIKLAPASRTLAFPPSEIGVGPYGSGRSLARALDLDRDTGLRAMGGYLTDKGARIPIQIPH